MQVFVMSVDWELINRWMERISMILIYSPRYLFHLHCVFRQLCKVHHQTASAELPRIKSLL